MKVSEIITELSKSFPNDLANDLLTEFLQIRNDLKTQTLSRSSVGKFIETTVQLLEHAETGTHSTSPNVDAYLKNLESRGSPLNDDLRITLSRIARATYTLRNKRNIAHKGWVDTNIYDLRHIYSCVQWILTEFVRQYITDDIHKAGEIVEFIQLPVNSVIETIDGRKIVHAALSTKNEILVVLYSLYPMGQTLSEIHKSMDRRAKSSIYNTLKPLWKEKLVHINEQKQYFLTQPGFIEAENILKNISTQ